MSVSRKNFVKKMALVGGGGLLYMTGITSFLKACKREEEPRITKSDFKPAYYKLEEKEEFAERIEQLYDIFEECKLCPRQCGKNRLEGETGFCRATTTVKVSSHQPHFYEELPLVGRGGSGTIFFSNCNLRCVFCQNWPIAHEGWGTLRSDEELANMMIDLQNRGCHNINVVTPTHVMPNIVNALRRAMQKGLRLPLCYNTSGYERPEIIKLLDGIVDIYLPDLKFMEGTEAERYNHAAAYDYPDMARESIIEMHRQVGDLVADENGIALSGLMIRHLVMPNRIAGTREFVHWVAEKLSTETYVNIMPQYRVDYEAFGFEEINRAITAEEYIEAMEWALDAGLTNLDERSLAQMEVYRRNVGRN